MNVQNRTMEEINAVGEKIAETELLVINPLNPSRKCLYILKIFYEGTMDLKGFHAR